MSALDRPSGESVGYVRDMAEIIDDHPWTDCDLLFPGSRLEVCIDLHDAARWPRPFPGHRLDTKGATP